MLPLMPDAENSPSGTKEVPVRLFVVLTAVADGFESVYLFASRVEKQNNKNTVYQNLQDTMKAVP